MITVGSEKLSSNIRRKLRMTLAFQKRVFSFFFLVIDLKINKGRVASLLLLKKKKKRGEILILMLYLSIILYLTSVIKFGSDTLFNKKRHLANSPTLVLGSCQE